MFRQFSLLGSVALVLASAVACDDTITVPVGQPGSEQPVETSGTEVTHLDDGSAVLTLEVNGATRVLDTVGGTINTGETDVAGIINVRYAGDGIVAWEWNELRIHSQGTGGSRYAVVVGDIADSEGVSIGDYGGQLYRIVAADRIDRTHAVLIAHQGQEITNQDEEYPNIRVLKWDADNGISETIGVNGIMADEVLGARFDAETYTVDVSHSYHGEQDDTVVEL